jgi:CRP/FNR family transcriptional regulator, nitrogen oxide reductase regulator
VISSEARTWLNGSSSPRMLSADVFPSMKGLAPRFLEGLSPAEVKVVLSAAKQLHLPAKWVVTEQGDPASHFFLLTAGRSRYFFVTRGGRKHVLLWLPPGEVFGSASLLPKRCTYIVSTETVKPSSVLVWKRTTIMGLARRYPRLAENVLEIASDYLRIYVATHVALTSNTAQERLSQVLANLAFGFGRKVTDGIELDVTNEDLAHAANVTHFTVSRLLNKWSRLGAVAKRRGKILILSEELLLHEGI